MTEYIADVSEFQPDVDWPTYGASYRGVIIRAHNGWRPDYQWTRNRDGARASVMWRGFYQYLPASVDPVAAARAFQATTGPLLPGEVAILDLEEGTGDQRARRQAWLDTLQDDIEWTYSGLAFARAHLPGVRIEWIAAYGQAEPTVSHLMWQFTDARTFAGIAKPCDASIFHGTIQPGISGGLGRSIGGGAPVLTPTGSTPTPAPPQEDDMATPLIYRRSDGAVMIVTPDGPQPLSLAQWQVWVNLLGDGEGNVTPKGMYAMDPGPFDAITASLTLDHTAQIVAGVIAALPTGGAGPTAAQIADELAKRLAS